MGRCQCTTRPARRGWDRTISPWWTRSCGSTAITRRLITQGANVLAVDRNEAGLLRLAAEVSGLGVLATFTADVSDSEQVLGYATRAFELWGQVDGFVNNAGIQTKVRAIVDFPEEDFDRVGLCVGCRCPSRVSWRRVEHSPPTDRSFGL
jgi:Enoyl-(Acyl carrier protein) reductase